jgi:hypothetical protein
MTHQADAANGQDIFCVAKNCVAAAMAPGISAARTDALRKKPVCADFGADS